MAENSEIIEKVKKLLALSKSSNPNEANAALAKANELMLRHEITMSQVQQAGGRKFVNQQFKGKFTRETNLILLILKEFFFVDYIVEGDVSGFDLIGTKSNVEVAIYLFHHIRYRFVLAWEGFKLEEGIVSESHRNDFMTGVFAGLQQKLKVERTKLSKEQGLIWTGKGELDDLMQKLYPNSQTVSNKQELENLEIANSGFNTGRHMDLHAGVRGRSESQGLSRTMRLGKGK